jgi:methionine synthase I (cobalamin-dependent)
MTSTTAPTRSRRNTFGCNLVNLGDYDIADKSGLAFKGTAIAKRVGVDRSDELGVRASIG